MEDQAKQCARCKNFDSEKNFCIYYKMRVSKSSIFTCKGFVEFEELKEKVSSVDEQIIQQEPVQLPRKAPSFSEMLKKTEVRIESEKERFKRIYESDFIKYSFEIDEVQALLLIKKQLTSLDLICDSFDHVKMTAEYSGYPKGINENLLIDVKIIEQEAIITAWARKIQNATAFLTYFNIMLVNVFDSISKMEDKIKKLNQIVQDSNKILKILITLFNHFEKNWQVGEVIFLLKDIRSQIEEKMPTSFVIKKIEDWILTFDKQYGNGITEIPERFVIDLEYEILDWLFEINKIAFNNTDLYLQTFPELSTQIQIHMNRLQTNFPLFAELEQNYIRNILQYLIVIEKETGLMIFQENFAPAAIEVSLISGFLNAIQEFGTQMLQDASSMRRLSYKNYEILLDDETDIIAAILLKGKPSDNISKRLRIFVTEFESHFKNEIKIWNGNLRYFFPAREMVKKIFNI